MLHRSAVRELIRHVVVASILLMCTAPLAYASPLLSLTGDAAGMGGLQPGTAPAGSAAAYWNPALLTDSPDGLEVGFMVLHQQIGIRLDGRPGPTFAIPEGVSNAAHSDADFSRFDNYPVPTTYLEFGQEGDGVNNPGFRARPRQSAGSGQQTTTYEVVGLTLKLFEDYLALGFYGFIPNGDFTRMGAFYNDEREQYFSNSLHPELYGDRMTAVSLAFAAGVRLYEGLSIGVGATLNLQAEVVAPTYVVDPGELEKILIDLQAVVNVSLAPHFGINYALLGDRLRLTATAHAPSAVKLTTKFTFLLSTGVEQEAGVDFLLNYMPWQAGLGVAGDLIHSETQSLTVAGTLRYAKWSSYTDRHGDAPTESYAWSDTLSPTVGLRYERGWFSGVADASYVPSPVPEQSGRSNYVDNDRISAVLGGQFSFDLWRTKLGLGLQMQAHRLLLRHHTKLPTPTSPDGVNQAPELVKDEVPDDAQVSGEPFDGARGLQTNNPGWPGFESQGWVLAGSIYLRVSI